MNDNEERMKGKIEEFQEKSHHSLIITQISVYIRCIKKMKIAINTFMSKQQ